VIVGHSLDIAVKLIEARLHPSSEHLAALTPASAQETKRARCATVVLQPWILRSKDGATSFHTGMQCKAGYPRWLKSAAFKMQDAMIDFAYCPQLNAFRCAPAVAAVRRSAALTVHATRSELGLQPVKRVYHRWFLCKGKRNSMPWLAGGTERPTRRLGARLLPVLAGLSSGLSQAAEARRFSVGRAS
jgi:hypothetical protein